MKHLGGQNHAQCGGEHHLPLISSTERSNKCQCGRQEYLRCCAFDCKVYSCERCFERHDENLNTTINVPNNENDNNDDDDGLEEPHGDREGENRHDTDSCYLSDDNNDDNNDDIEMILIVF